MHDGPFDMNALLPASLAAKYAGVTTAAVCNWAARGILPVATDERGNEIRDARGRARYRLGDVARAEARTHERAQQLAARITRRTLPDIAA